MPVYCKINRIYEQIYSTVVYRKCNVGHPSHQVVYLYLLKSQLSSKELEKKKQLTWLQT